MGPKIETENCPPNSCGFLVVRYTRGQEENIPSRNALYASPRLFTYAPDPQSDSPSSNSILLIAVQIQETKCGFRQIGRRILQVSRSFPGSGPKRKNLLLKDKPVLGLAWRSPVGGAVESSMGGCLLVPSKTVQGEAVINWKGSFPFRSPVPYKMA